ncbi:jg4942 [Pararge aegeria aegeria]|uniref:Jg4942 protein n=1 Tax=Pararge aegeria aegeria TaxID=348720 RepID=A0A8S4SIF9_9NEOP|nr:jg4942 [Pararge aegeria aegeria]
MRAHTVTKNRHPEVCYKIAAPEEASMTNTYTENCLLYTTAQCCPFPWRTDDNCGLMSGGLGFISMQGNFGISALIHVYDKRFGALFRHLCLLPRTLALNSEYAEDILASSIEGALSPPVDCYKIKHPPSACVAFECPSNRRSWLQSEEPPHNTRRFKDYCLLYPALDPTTKGKLLKILVEAFREKTSDILIT